MSEEVKVFGAWGSPFSRRVELALKLKGVQYEYIEEDVYNNKSPLLLKYNPVHKKIPVLLHNGKPIAESLVILEYIEETWKGNPILPEDPYEKAMARFWARFLDEKCLPALWNAAWSPENEREKSVEEACDFLKTLASALKGKRFFGGDTVGLVDIAANFIGFWLRVLQEATGQELLSAEKFPDLVKWTNEFVSCSVVKESLPPRDRLLAFFKARVAGAMDAQTKASK
ncbi:glutathione S-transferase U8-like [Durio zibethinus]|uniref:glutathione transferase n=1 Tax=Durio zibethinus TaxID=66656 RepID=A0A6P5Z1W6_DURZI|nr:glutathione S-transferase U8-like [Durio zibethinus]XP_022747067.1 glutathione S-transferase U8-like [Durio zibethinus]